MTVTITESNTLTTHTPNDLKDMPRNRRYRLNLSLREADYLIARQVAADYGFDSACQLMTTLLRMFCRHVRTAESLRAEAEADAYTDEADIEDAFQEFTRWEREPDGTVPMNRNHPRRDIR